MNDLTIKFINLEIFQNILRIFSENIWVMWALCLQDNEPSCDDLAVDYEYFNEVVWPLLAHRIPTFEKLKVCYRD